MLSCRDDDESYESVLRSRESEIHLFKSKDSSTE